MSETQTPAPSPIPHVAFNALVDKPTTIVVHLGDKIRMFAADTKEHARDLITKVMIAEFGVPQEEARTASAAAVAGQTARTDAVAHVALLQEQLADTDKQLTVALAAKAKAESDLKAAQDEISELKKAAFVASETISQMEAASLQANEAAIKAVSPAEGASTVTGAQGAR